MGRATGSNNKDLGALQLIQGLFGTLGSAGRGLVAGTAGLPGDIESLVRMLPGFSEKTILPTTKEVSAALPQLPAAYRQPVAESMGQMGAMTPGQVAKLGAAGKAGALALLNRVATPPRAITQAGAVKPRGGNWLPNEIEGALSGLKTHRGVVYPPGSQGPLIDKTLNNWIDGPLAKYIQRDMGTTNDIIPKLADQGIQINEAPYGAVASDMLAKRRLANGFRAQSQAATPEGRAWENTMDSLIAQMPRSELSNARHAENPWLAKLPRDTPIYRVGDDLAYESGFAHMIDELSNSLQEGHLRPEQLDSGRFSVEAAVRHVADVNAARAKKAEEAMTADLSKIPLHKEYPESGYSWRQLKLADDGWQKMPDGWSRPDPDMPGFNMTSKEDPRQAQLAKWLKEEGDAMGHCVGGYCDPVASGASNIYSLRDAKGRPHVTIETTPASGEELYKLNADWLGSSKELADAHENLNQYAGNLAEYTAGLKTLAKEHGVELQVPDTQHIAQIKGKGNAKPAAEYLPLVQDFIRSGKWSSIGDLQNSGLRKLDDVMTGDDFRVLELSKLRKAGHLDNLPEYINDAELETLKAKLAPQVPPEQFAAGGLVHGDDDFSMPGHF